jgi:hypothetical protein
VSWRSIVSSVRSRLAGLTGADADDAIDRLLKILPSPILPVRAASVITLTTCCTLSFGVISTFTFGTKSTTYAEPR